MQRKPGILIGGFAVILHGYVRATKDIDLLVDASEENVRRLKQAMAFLPDNAIELIEDDDVERYGVVRVADENCPLPDRGGEGCKPSRRRHAPEARCQRSYAGR